ncbi:hypothetical protein CEXT_291341 [Caerostris extrusa]|uniref:Uncharacterized protein n=1 Tax=Caerostris extrusa TaxID=172846 RepID=A0AAV4W4W7_CAEEX|nr:hypothetical protein CEXT_291341 [Caerostris extrusa]
MRISYSNHQIAGILISVFYPLLNRSHRFSMGLKSGDFAGQSSCNKVCECLSCTRIFSLIIFAVVILKNMGVNLILISQIWTETKHPIIQNAKKAGSPQ